MISKDKYKGFDDYESCHVEQETSRRKRSISSGMEESHNHWDEIPLAESFLWFKNQ